MNDNLTNLSALSIEEKIETNIHIVYGQCNVIIAPRGSDDITRNMWLASMGMLDTLIILGVRAAIWEDWG